MFTNISKAGVGGSIVVLLEAIFPLFGIEVPEGTVAGVIEAILTVVGFGLLIWGQIDREDLKFGLVRK